MQRAREEEGGRKEEGRSEARKVEESRQRLWRVGNNKQNNI